MVINMCLVTCELLCVNRLYVPMAVANIYWVKHIGFVLSRRYGIEGCGGDRSHLSLLDLILGGATKTHYLYAASTGKPLIITLYWWQLKLGGSGMMGRCARQRGGPSLGFALYVISLVNQR